MKAASIVLTIPGLGDIASAVETNRRIYQRMLTYTLNKIIKTIELARFLSLGLVFTHSLVVTPLLIAYKGLLIWSGRAAFWSSRPSPGCCCVRELTWQS